MYNREITHIVSKQKVYQISIDCLDQMFFFSVI